MDIRDKAARYLSRCSRTEKELSDYLRKNKFEEEEIKEVINEFVDYGYLNDRSYSWEFFRYSMDKGWGKYKIFHELAKRGIDQSMAEMEYEDFLEENRDKEYSESKRAKAVADKIVYIEGRDENGRVSDKTKGKIARRLKSYGYSSGIIYEIIENLNWGSDFFD